MMIGPFHPRESEERRIDRRCDLIYMGEQKKHVYLLLRSTFDTRSVRVVRLV